MLTYIVRRVLLAILTTWFITIISFIIIQLPPGDFVDAYVEQLRSLGISMREGEAERLRQDYGLDQPVFVQYLKWMGKVVRGNFGMSLELKQPVDEVIGERLGLTIVLSLASVLLTWALALPIGIYSAVRQYTLGDYIFTVIGFIGLAVPNFLLALVVMYLGWAWFGFGIGGLFSVEYVHEHWGWAKVLDLLRHLPLPALILALAGTAHLIRVMRANLLDELGKPYVVTARAKGLPEGRLILKYPVRIAMNPFVSSIGYLLPNIVSGSIIISLVMNLPTIGPVLFRALLNQDMFLAATIIMLLSFLTVIGTLLSDLLLLWVDPRIRVEGR